MSNNQKWAYAESFPNDTRTDEELIKKWTSVIKY